MNVEKMRWTVEDLEYMQKDRLARAAEKARRDLCDWKRAAKEYEGGGRKDEMERSDTTLDRSLDLSTEGRHHT